MVAAVVVMPAPTVVGVLAAIPDIRKRRHRAGLSAIELVQKSGIDRFAVTVDSILVKVKSACQKLFVACHDVGEISKGLGRVSVGADVNVNAAASCGVALGSCFAKAADQLLQNFHVGVGEDRRDHLVFFAVRSCDADVLLEFPFPASFVPGRPGAVAVAASRVLVMLYSEELCCNLCSFFSSDAVHLDLDPNEDDRYILLPYFWLPEETLDLRVRRDHVPYDLWERQGYIMTTEGNVVHYGYIEQFIGRLGERFNIREIAFDRWDAVQMTQNLESMGFSVVPFGQGFKDMSPPTKELMKLLLERKIAHGGHPVLRWMMDNIYIRTDPAGNIKADKEKSTEKIDGVIAAIMGLDRAIRCGNDTTESVYDNRGFIAL